VKDIVGTDAVLSLFGALFLLSALAIRTVYLAVCEDPV